MSPTPDVSSRFFRDALLRRVLPAAWATGALVFAGVFAFSLYFLVFSSLLSLPFLGLISGLGALAFVPLFPTRLWWGRGAIALIGIGLLALFFDRPARELDARVDALADQARQQGPQTWTAAERQGLMLLSATMARSALLFGYTEVSREHMGMHHAGPATRDFRGVFPRESSTLMDFVCRSDATAQRLFIDEKVPRYNLAFNGAYLRKRVSKAAIDVELTIAIRYRARSRSFLFATRGLAGGRHLLRQRHHPEPGPRRALTGPAPYGQAARV